MSAWTRSEVCRTGFSLFGVGAGVKVENFDSA